MPHTALTHINNHINKHLTGGERVSVIRIGGGSQEEECAAGMFSSSHAVKHEGESGKKGSCWRKRQSDLGVLCNRHIYINKNKKKERAAVDSLLGGGSAAAQWPSLARTPTTQRDIRPGYLFFSLAFHLHSFKSPLLFKIYLCGFKSISK